MSVRFGAAVVVALLLAGCGGPDASPAAEPSPPAYTRVDLGVSTSPIAVPDPCAAVSAAKISAIVGVRIADGVPAEADGHRICRYLGEVTVTLALGGSRLSVPVVFDQPAGEPEVISLPDSPTTLQSTGTIGGRAEVALMVAQPPRSYAVALSGPGSSATYQRQAAELLHELITA